MRPGWDCHSEGSEEASYLVCVCVFVCKKKKAGGTGQLAQEKSELLPFPLPGPFSHPLIPLPTPQSSVDPFREEPDPSREDLVFFLPLHPSLLSPSPSHPPAGAAHRICQCVEGAQGLGSPRGW